MKTKIRNFLINIENQTVEATQIFLSSITNFELKTILVYLLFKRNLIELLSLEQLILVLNQLEIASRERRMLWDRIKQRALSFDKMAFVWRHLTPSLCKESEEEIDLSNQIKIYLMKSRKDIFYKMAWMYVETQEKFWWEKARDHASSIAELTWMVESMSNFHNSWHDDGSEWIRQEYEEEMISLEEQIKEQVALGQQEVTQSKRDETCRAIDTKIEAVVFVPIDYTLSSLSAKQEAGKEQDQVQAQPQVGSSNCEVKNDDFDKKVELWKQTESGSMKEALAFEKLKKLANTFERELFVWMNEKPGSTGEVKALERLKVREKTLRQKLYFLSFLEGEDKKQLWFDVESNIKATGEAMLVWVKTEKIIEKRKKTWILVKKDLNSFSQMISLRNDPPITLTAIEDKDLWSLLVMTASKLEELAWVWIHAQGKVRTETYNSFVKKVEGDIEGDIED